MPSVILFVILYPRFMVFTLLSWYLPTPRAHILGVQFENWRHHVAPTLVTMRTVGEGRGEANPATGQQIN